MLGLEIKTDNRIRTLKSPEENVDFGESFPLFSAFRTFILLGGRPPQGQAMSTETVPTVQGGGIDQNVVTAMAEELTD